MISFNLNYTLLFNMGVDFLSIGVILPLYINSKKDTMDVKTMRVLCKVQMLVMIVLVTDIFMWLLNGLPGLVMRVLSYLDNMVYFTCQVLLVMEWIQYVYYRLYGKKMSRKMKRVAIRAPFLAVSVCIVSSPFNKGVFYLDSANYYHRGVLSFPLSIITLCYLFFASSMALVRRKKELLTDRKKELLVLSFFAIPPFLGGMAQAFLYGCSLLWPCVTLSILLVYIDVKHREISKDALTVLYNRGHLNQYLSTYIDNEPNQKAALIMMDLNDFKMINDCFGHRVGDAALVQTAHILQNSFSEMPAFLFRYGGDEFVAVLIGGQAEAAKDAIEKIEKNIDAFNRKGAEPYELSLSMGYAVYPTAKVDSADELLKAADRQMYLKKEAYHAVGKSAIDAKA